MSRKSLWHVSRDRKQKDYILQLKWNDNHQSEYSLTWLREYNSSLFMHLITKETVTQSLQFQKEGRMPRPKYFSGQKRICRNPLNCTIKTSWKVKKVSEVSSSRTIHRCSGMDAYPSYLWACFGAWSTQDSQGFSRCDIKDCVSETYHVWHLLGCQECTPSYQHCIHIE